MRLLTRVRVVLMLTLLIPAAGFAADVLVLAAGAMQPGLIAAESAFRKQSGHQIKVTYAIASELRRRVGGGEVADVVFAPVAGVAELTKNGTVAAEGQIAVGRVGAGVVARRCWIFRTRKRSNNRCSQRIA